MVADLLAHLGQVEDWVRRMLRTREYAEERQPDPQRGVTDFIDGVAGYLTAMRAITPDEPCWAFGPEPHRAGFWIRRQHAVHRVDLESAFGTAPDLDTAFAADGVDEILTLFRPAEQHCAPVLLIASDTRDRWSIGVGEPVTTATAPAKTLYLRLWNRLDLFDNSQVEGDSVTAARPLKFR